MWRRILHFLSSIKKVHTEEKWQAHLLFLPHGVHISAVLWQTFSQANALKMRKKGALNIDVKYQSVRILIQQCLKVSAGNLFLIHCLMITVNDIFHCKKSVSPTRMIWWYDILQYNTIQYSFIRSCQNAATYNDRTGEISRKWKCENGT